MTFRIIDENYKPFDEQVATISKWYDRHTRDYCIQKLNKEGYQIGDAIRVGDKKAAEQVAKDLKAEYGIK